MERDTADPSRDMKPSKHAEELRIERERRDQLRRMNDALEGRVLLVETIAATMKAKR